MRRKKLNKSKSKRSFAAGASKTESINMRGAPMRGGFRL